jgi:hypothetical protein
LNSAAGGGRFLILMRDPPVSLLKLRSAPEP